MKIDNAKKNETKKQRATPQNIYIYYSAGITIEFIAESGKWGGKLEAKVGLNFQLKKCELTFFHLLFHFFVNFLDLNHFSSSRSVELRMYTFFSLDFQFF